MTLTDAERRFLARYARGPLATIGPDGLPRVKPLGFSSDHPGFKARDIGPADGAGA